MSIRFSTEAANADVLGEDTLDESAPGEAGAGESTRARDRDPRRGKASEQGEAKPGKDINAPGFLKDPDAVKPS